MKLPRIIAGLAILILLAVLVTGCGTNWRVEYQNPQYGSGAVEFALPTKGGYAK